MHVLILGCDMLGVHLTAALADAGHSVTVLDGSPDRLGALPQVPHVEAALTSDFFMDDLRGAGINGADVFLALSDDDNKNALAAQVARDIFHVREVICLITDPEREKFYAGLGIKVVCPTLVMVEDFKKALVLST